MKQDSNQEEKRSVHEADLFFVRRSAQRKFVTKMAHGSRGGQWRRTIPLPDRTGTHGTFLEKEATKK